MSSDQQNYLHILCADYALLLDADHVEEVVGANKAVLDEGLLRWREQSLDVIDLCQVFVAEGANDVLKREYLVINIVNESEQEKQYFALVVTAVNQIQAIHNQAFSDIPQLNFPSNRYFDKAYIHPESRQCIYRIRLQQLTELVANT